MALVDVGLIPYPFTHYAAGSSLTLDALDEHIAFVVRAPKTGTLKKIGWRINAISSPVMTVKVSVETVADAIGVPVATTNAGKTLYAAGAESADITSFSAGACFNVINGSSGISVTRGHLIAVTVRVTGYTSGSINVSYSQYGVQVLGSYVHRGETYTYGYNGNVGTPYYEPIITLEYDGEFVVCPHTKPVNSTDMSSMVYNSTSNPDRRGMKFRLPYGCSIKGVTLYGDLDVDTDIILYDADEYTVMSGFPITIDKDKRPTNTMSAYYVELPGDITLIANQYYRLVLLPKDTTNITTYTSVPADDGSILGMNAYPEGMNVAYTTFNGAPSSGSHAWTDEATRRILMSVMINKIDLGGSGGGPVMGGMVVR